MNYIGIDPGLNGGIAIIDQDNNVNLCIPMPVKNGEVEDMQKIVNANEKLVKGVKNVELLRE